MKKKLIVACMAGLMVSGGLFGAAERKAAISTNQSCINARLLIFVLNEELFFLNHSIDSETNLNGKDQSGETILMLAALDNKKTETLQFLLSDQVAQKSKQKININAQSNDGSTALQMALANSSSAEGRTELRINMAKILMENGANPLIKDNKGWSPLRLIKAAAKDEPEYQELLKWMVQKGYAPKEQAPGGPKIAE